VSCKVNRDRVARIDSIQEALPDAIKLEPPHVLGPDHFEADSSKGIASGFAVVHRLPQLLVDLQVVVGVDSDCDRDTLFAPRRGRPQRRRRKETCFDG
jgi:hypothetical protein